MSLGRATAHVRPLLFSEERQKKGYTRNEMTDFRYDEDVQLVLRVAQGDQEAFLALYDRYAPRVFALVLRMLGERMAAEEVPQDTFMKLWTRARLYTPRKGRVLSWLLTIARRTALDRIRLDERRPDRNNPQDPDTLLGSFVDPRSLTEESRWHTLRFAFTEPGTYTYHCAFHATMQGTITVTP